MEKDKLKNRINHIPDDLCTRDEVSKLKQELNKIENTKLHRNSCFCDYDFVVP
jgi:hypothetical protein